jgi:hypothetical protein
MMRRSKKVDLPVQPGHKSPLQDGRCDQTVTEMSEDGLAKKS